MATKRTSGSIAAAAELIDVKQLVDLYHVQKPDPQNPRQKVAFGTSGHRGTSLDGTFTDGHIAAIAQAICDYRRDANIGGPLFVGKDTHALSSPAQITALEVLIANGVEAVIQAGDGFTPTPVISRQIIEHNRDRVAPRADGIVITPSHNPPRDGGFKYNPPHGGPADSAVTGWIQDRANAILAARGSDVRRKRLEKALADDAVKRVDFVQRYVQDLANVIDFDCIRAAGLRIGVDPLGGASVAYWEPIRAMYGIDLTVVNETVDPQFAFMPLDHDGRIRMDCSSPHAMANLVRLKDDYDIAFGTDPDADRHGIVTRSAGLMNPNHFLAVAVRYLFTVRDRWPRDIGVGKTAVSSGIIDRVAASLARDVFEVPVGFKWFVDGLANGQYAFAGEESAGASFLRRDGSVWTTDKDGLIMGLLAAEITARTGRDPGEHFAEIAAQFGQPHYRRIDQPATPEEKRVLKNLSPEAVKDSTLAGDPILERLTAAPGNGAPLEGLKVVTANGWFAARPSGTENIYKIYAESFTDETHLHHVIDEAREIVGRALNSADQ
ncbi:MAG: alpha-D-glucose phosphate-specific phosphoglucomutase [Planctomycetes bacterium]|nr:alpha-D-glucose phosphate-specific phosphoglucomutase [Planctomycetota bacterium]